MFSRGEILEIPSPIDVHTHLREPGGEEKETIESGTLAALHGGYQAVFDMPNNPRGNETWTEERLDKKTEIAIQTTNTDIGFYAGVDIDNPDFSQIPALVRKSSGVKFYLGPTTGNTKVRGLDEVRDYADEWIKESKEQGTQAPILLHAREEIGFEVADYVARQNHKVHWCHIADQNEVLFASVLAKKYPELFFAGVTPHHLTMTSRNADFQQGWNGARMQPPLGEDVDADMLLYYYNSGVLNILETDHAPHTNEDKMNAEGSNPEGHTDEDCVTCYGVSGIEFVLPVMMSLVQRNIIDMDRLIDSLYTKPIEMLGLKEKGSIDNPRSVTAIMVNPYVISGYDIAGKSRNTPYIGWTGWGKIIGVHIDGEDGFITSENRRVITNGSDI